MIAIKIFVDFFICDFLDSYILISRNIPTAKLHLCVGYT